MDNEYQMVDMLRAVRHDWFNDLQLVKANLTLKRVERVEQIVDEMIAKSKNEAKLSNLNAPKLFTLFLTYNWKAQPFRLELEVTGVEVDLSGQDEVLSEFFSKLFGKLGTALDPESDNVVTLSMDIMDSTVTFTVDLIGKIENNEALTEWLHKDHSNHSLCLVKDYIKKEEAVIGFQITED